jgi:high-affinity nickel permease
MMILVELLKLVVVGFLFGLGFHFASRLINKLK